MASRAHYSEVAERQNSPGFAPTSNSVATRHIVVAIALVALAVMIWLIAEVLIIGFGGIVLAALLRAAAVPLARKTGIAERWSVLIVVLAIIAAFTALSWLFGHQAMKQVADLQDQLPVAIDKLTKTVEQSEIGKFVVDSVRQTSSDSKILSNMGLAATALVGGVTNILLVLFLGVYFAVDPKLYRNGALRLLPPHLRGKVGDALDDAGLALQKWLLGQGAAMVTVGVLVGIGLSIIGVPLVLALSVLAAFLEFIPVLGPVLFAIPGLLLAFTQGPQTVLYALIVYVIVEQLESNVVTPLLQRWAVQLPPVIGLLAIVAGGLLLGIPGIIFATPLVVVVMKLVQHLYVEDTLENGASRSSPSSRSTTK